MPTPFLDRVVVVVAISEGHVLPVKTKWKKTD